ncbi:hypothetical protein SAMN03159338_1463 [Sphingomonas sp. NFR04]|nr:hypothetical protein SAMN03159338_1463 [Sphingomonas sp. NFR04]
MTKHAVRHDSRERQECPTSSRTLTRRSEDRGHRFESCRVHFLFTDLTKHPDGRTENVRKTSSDEMRSNELSARRFGRRFCARLANRTASCTDRVRVSGRKPEADLKALNQQLMCESSQRGPTFCLTLVVTSPDTIWHDPQPLRAQFQQFQILSDLPKSGREQIALERCCASGVGICGRRRRKRKPTPRLGSCRKIGSHVRIRLKALVDELVSSGRDSITSLPISPICQSSNPASQRRSRSAMHSADPCRRRRTAYRRRASSRGFASRKLGRCPSIKRQRAFCRVRLEARSPRDRAITVISMVVKVVDDTTAFSSAR